MSAPGNSLTEAHRQVGIYAGRVLRDEKPADLPVVLDIPTNFFTGRWHF
jgi:hypothetical protein